MAMTVVSQPESGTRDLVLHPLHGLATLFPRWRESRRQRADAALLMRLEPQMLKDIGVILAEQRGGVSAILKWHPAVLGPSMDSHHRETKER